MNWKRLTFDNAREICNLGENDMSRTVLFCEGRYYGINEFTSSIHALVKRGNVYFCIVPKIAVS